MIYTYTYRINLQVALSSNTTWFCARWIEKQEEGVGVFRWIKKTWHLFLGGGNSNIFYVSPLSWGNDPIWRAYFSNGWEKTTNQFWLHLFDSMRLETARQKFKQSEWAAWRAIRWCYFPLFMAELWETRTSQIQFVSEDGVFLILFNSWTASLRAIV